MLDPNNHEKTIYFIDPPKQEVVTINYMVHKTIQHDLKGGLLFRRWNY
jgi:hypothetical protein